MQFNKDQREGLAKQADNLSTASMVAVIVGGLVDRKIGWEVTAVLFGFFLILSFAALMLRKGDKNGD